MDDAVEQALSRRGIYVEGCQLQDVQQAVMAAAPDLVLLLGDAAKDGGVEALGALRTHPGTATAAVAVLSDGEQLDARMTAFRHGAVATVPRSASADDIGKRIVSLLHELPNRTGAVSGELGEATLDELTDLVREELRSGILSVEGDEGAPVRIVFGAGKPVSEALEEFVKKLRPLVQRTEPLRYELFEEPESRLRLSGFPAENSGNKEVFSELSVLIADNDSGRADALAQALRAAGSTVIVIGSSNADLSRTRDLDPDVVIFDQDALAGPDFDLVRLLRQDLRLRWAALLLADWPDLWPDRGQPVDLGRLALSVGPLVDGVRELTRLVDSQHLFDTRLENTGPSRLLRILTRSGSTYHVTVHSTRATVEVDVADGLIVGALGTRPDGPPMEGVQALAGMLALSTGRIRVERRDNPSTANIMAPPEVALGAALAEKLPILPSVLPSRVRSGAATDAVLGEANTAFAMAAAVPPPSQPLGKTKPGLGPALAEGGAKTVPAPSNPDESGPLHPQPSAAPFKAPSATASDASWGVGATLLGIQPAIAGAVPTAPGVPTETDRSLGPPRPGIHRLPLGSLEPPTTKGSDAAPDSTPAGTVADGAVAAGAIEALEAEPDPFASAPAPSVAPPVQRKGSSWLMVLVKLLVAMAVVVLGALTTVVGYRLVKGPSASPRLNAWIASVGGEAFLPPEVESGRPARPPSEPDAPTTPVAPVLVEAESAPQAGTEPQREEEAEQERPEAPAEDVAEPAPEAAAAEAPEQETQDDAEVPEEVEAPEGVEDPATQDPPPEAVQQPVSEDPPPAALPETEPSPTSTEGVDPSRSANSVIREGERLVRQGKTLDAAPFFERALELRPRDNHALIGMAQVWLARGEPARAVPLAEEAVQLRSRRVPYRLVLADAYRGAGQHADARREYNRILRSEPGHREATAGLRALQTTAE